MLEPLARACAGLAVAALGFVGFVVVLDATFFAIVPSARAGRPNDEKG
jgi:hypothetical protein